jgi:patatin-like phospholipase
MAEGLLPDVAPTATEATCACTCERDRHFFCPGPKRLLALDGGGVRGAITVAFLEQIETVLSERLGRTVHLAHWFDLIGGTSTGAIIAGALAMGYTTADIKRFYFELAPKVFRRPFWRIVGLRAKFDARLLQEQIESIVGEQKLSSEEMITGFCLLSKRIDTGSAWWILANNPRARYWHGKPDPNGHIGNKDYSLAKLVRASTAAPFYFEPESIEIAEGAKPGWFVDGGVTPHNNPSLMLFLMTILNAYKIGWTATPDRLTIVSIGTGSHRDRLVPEELRIGRTTRLALRTLKALISDAERFVLAQMQYLGVCPAPWTIDSELERLEGENPDGKRFRFLRYNVVLERDWLDTLRDEVGPQVFDDKLGRRLTDNDIVRLRGMDDPTIIEDIYQIARFAAHQQVKADDWTGELATWCGGARPSAPTRHMEWPERGPDPAWVRISKSISIGLSYLRTMLARLLYSPPPS